MAVQAIDYDTGSVVLPDIGILEYNGVQFSSLYHTRMSAKPVRDNANRTTKYVEYVLEAVGVVTLKSQDQDTDNTLVLLRKNLSAQGGALSYTGRGYGSFVVNTPGNVIPTPGPSFGGVNKDVAWGPTPEVLDFQPLGAGQGAYVVWRVTIRMFEFQTLRYKSVFTLPVSNRVKGQKDGPVLQFNFDTSVVYLEDHYTQLRLSGTLEIPMTRNAVNDNSLPDSVYNYQQAFMQAVIGSIDQTRFYITRRSFPISRDRRTMEWEVIADEQPPMGDPPGCVQARGRFTVKPMKTKKNAPLSTLPQWTCSLSITYAVRKDQDRRLAWLAFTYMVWYRMQWSRFANLPAKKDYTVAGFNENDKVNPTIQPPSQVTFDPAKFYADPALFYRDLFSTAQQRFQTGVGAIQNKAQAWLVDMGMDEGMHRDSKTVTFEATWILFTSLSNILVASGLWRVDSRSVGGNVWRLSMADVTGWSSWIRNAFNYQDDIIVDMGTRT